MGGTILYTFPRSSFVVAFAMVGDAGKLRRNRIYLYEKFKVLGKGGYERSWDIVKGKKGVVYRSLFELLISHEIMSGSCHR